MGHCGYTRNREELIVKSLAQGSRVWNDAWVITFLLAILSAVSITLYTPTPAQAAPTHALTILTPAAPKNIEASSPIPALATPPTALAVQKIAAAASTSVPSVPFYSQFSDITSPSWQKVGCGIASLAMLVDYYKPAVAVDTLLEQGIASGAYLSNAGWTYKGLIGVGATHGLVGTSYDLANQSQTAAYAELKKYLSDGPVMVSVHYKFDPASTIPHLVVINGIEGDTVYYNDPAAKAGQGELSSDKFLLAWKKRFIVLRPAKETAEVAVAR